MWFSTTIWFPPRSWPLQRRTRRSSTSGKRCGEKKITQAEINERMIRAARLGFEVVRLKSGDPAIFGRLAEEIDALESAGVPYEIVPGITAGIAAAASLGASLTDRRTNSRVIIISGHNAQDAPENDWRGLAREDASFIVYMPGRSLSRLRQDFLDAGLPPDFPAVIVSKASTPEQREWPTTLGELDSAPQMEAPSILLLGRSLARAAENSGARLLSIALQDSACRTIPRSRVASSVRNEFKPNHPRRFRMSEHNESK